MSQVLRNDFNREEDLTLTADMYRQGYTQIEIAKAINDRYKERGIAITVTRQTVGNDIRKLIKEWQEERIEDINEIKTIEIQKILMYQRESMKAWHRSYGEKIKYKNKTRLGEGDNGTFEESSEEKEELVGDPRFLKIAKECSDSICKIVGVFDKSIDSNDEEDEQINIIELPNDRRNQSK